MNRFALTVLLASSLALPLGGCAAMSDFTIDPTEWFSGDWFGNKKKLPGERKPVFPEGVPGVTRGVPPELIKGGQQPADVAGVPPGGSATDQAAIEEEQKPKPKAKPKPKPKVAAKPAAPAEADSRPTPVTVRRSDTPPSQQQPSATQWPEAPLARGSNPSGGVQWPDPPSTR
jgi:hypothetical protein